ncbi:hypothetical protein DFR74_102221 [Nocardia puris]|uniref:Thioesterase superfamily protein n=2 Tax=Nocardia puris TaxID=208602 RepID=A0A366DUN7_9NOCA|nr:hypothetical protein DFR74_102221 [Nocardia puris]
MVGDGMAVAGEVLRRMIEVDELTVPDHVHGYPQVAFGGYVAGVLAARCTAATVRVDFRAKVPVGEPLNLSATESGGAAMRLPSGTLLAEANPATLSVDVPPTPSWDDALAVTEAALASGKRPVTDCYGCGESCATGKGLRLFPWVLPESELITGGWVPDETLAGLDGILAPHDVWSALDCPGGLAGFVRLGMRRGAVTAALTATVLRPVRAGEPHITHAWPIAAQGRKYTVGVALSTAAGELCAVAEALWIEPRDLALDLPG